MSIIFIIQGKFISYTLSKFAKNFDIPSKGQCSFMDEWSLDALLREQYPSGPYHSELSTPEDIRTFIQTELTEHIGLIKGCVLVDNVMLSLGALRHRKRRKDIDDDETRIDEDIGFAAVSHPSHHLFYRFEKQANWANSNVQQWTVHEL
ncbi:hypothetical protein Tco_0552757 [Tanacetum coccineum]